MKPPTRIPLSAPVARVLASAGRRPNSIQLAFRPWRLAAARAVHTSPAAAAKVVPVYGTGPPPEPPAPAAGHADARISRRRQQAELLKRAKEVRDEKTAHLQYGGKALKKRFWKEVHVHEVDGALQVHLDNRPIRRPNNKEILRIPMTKPHLAHSLALEWDLLTSAQQATKQHLIPLTSLICRALDIMDDDAAAAAAAPGPARAQIATTLLRYLDTDSLLCWAPADADAATDASGRTLREVQEQTARPLTALLTARVWPGLRLEPALGSDSIVPRAQPAGTRDGVRAWLLRLDAWELAGLERAALAAKGLLGAVRLLVEWSEGAAGLAAGREKGFAGAAEEARFGVEEAARAASLEVDWQTRRWGEVEDSHDVDKEDLRRQLGSVVLLVSGTGSMGG